MSTNPAMSAQPKRERFKGITLPPSGWTLAALLALYIFTGLTGHDPWKNDDAVTIGIVHDLVANGNWLTLSLAGRPYPDAPLHYWVAAAGGHLFGWVIPVHAAARLASGVFTLLSLTFIYLAARELHGRDQAPAAPLLLAGSIGFLFHAHEAQPMLATLTAHTAAYWGLAQSYRRPLRGACCFGTALGLGFLANGLAPMLPLLPVAAFVAWRAENRRQAVLLLLGSLLLASVLAGAWLAALLIVAPDFLVTFWQDELSQLTGNRQPLLGLLRFLSLLPWYAWPALPLAGWTLWVKRRQLRSRSLAVPVFAFLLTLLVISVCLGARSAPALLLLPSLVLLAVPGVGSLRRGAANAFDWFNMITFSFFAALAWIGWSAMVFGWPEQLARQVHRLEPGFRGQFSLFGFSISLVATLIWCWLIATSPRSPMRGIMHWMAGLTLFWLLIAMLWMPWIDYGKTYRPVSASLARALPEQYGCIASANLADSILASLDYFDGIRTVELASAAGKQCELLLNHGPPSNGAWQLLWEGGRPRERDSDKLQLYRREERKGRPGPEQLDHRP
ncbi:glycosyltransferase family 39 protein [Accumulibacter sp.]|uniref:ArnT family glycosyltransferase n=1 Tax=Accumulibacter sp. TaxID=2053492 RepID=UPI0025CCE252|nr:glycosyltransferase family 39 protein [Accumulibacter sp.]MCP5229768.1 glycosyltransferase family 39 protein [Accumulibacter sp.]